MIILNLSSYADGLILVYSRVTISHLLKTFTLITKVIYTAEQNFYFIKLLIKFFKYFYYFYLRGYFRVFREDLEVRQYMVLNGYKLVIYVIGSLRLLYIHSVL